MKKNEEFVGFSYTEGGDKDEVMILKDEIDKGLEMAEKWEEKEAGEWQAVGRKEGGMIENGEGFVDLCRTESGGR